MNTRITTNIITVLGLIISANVSADMNDWQQQQLLDPPQYLLMAEAKGRVMIYDGLPVDVVDRAMDEQFDRIDSMMFTRVRVITDEGEQVMDDGC